MNSKRPGVFKNTFRAASGGILAIAALLMLMFMRGGGSGEGDGESDGEQPSPKPAESLVTTETTPDTTEPLTVKDKSEGGLTPDEQQALSDQMLGILIDERSYLLEVPGQDDTIYRPAELQRLLELAARTTGDSNGIRVRILRRESSRTTAEVELKSALAKIGIGDDAVYMPADFIP